jgi:excisionase family DNA binding protein
MEDNKNFSEAEAAQRLGVSRLTLWRARRRGAIAYLRIGRRVLYAPRHLEAFEQKYEQSCGGGRQ